MAEYFVSKGADIELRDKNGLTPLILAAICNHGEMVDLLITAGADMEARDENGSTALIHATLNDHNAIVKRLVSRGANVNMKNKYAESPVSIALSRGCHEMADYLKDYAQK
jgi:ankyrin repeat protein